MGKTLIDLTGRVVGRLTVLRLHDRVRHGHSVIARWRCRCACGEKTLVFGNQLRSGKTQSCGCWAREKARADSTTHGGSRTQLYQTWRGVLDRCTNPKHRAWKNYGGRGISVCADWRSFEVFRVAMGERPSPKHSLDRIDNDGNYEPGNVQWSTKSTQMRNTRVNARVTFGGETKSRTAWAETMGIGVETLRARIERYGWSVERALTTPAGAMR